MDADSVLSSGARNRGVPAPLDGEIIPPRPKGAEPKSSRPSAPSGAGRPGIVLIGAIAAALLGIGAAGGYYVWSRDTGPDSAAETLGRLQQDIGSLRTGVAGLKATADANRQDETIRALKKSVDALKAELDQTRASNTATLAQISAKIERPDRDTSPKLSDIAARLDKLDRDPGPKLGEIASRLDRIEKQVSSPATTGSIAATPHAAAQTPAPAPSVSAQAAERSKPAALGSYVLRDVYDGIALVEGRNGGIREVTPGQLLPGAGEVRSIERRGRAWIVVTSRGVIDDSTW